ncbi:hypothetical protein [Streptococcus himalayensis]|uniref:Accessory secretory protein Asp4 n=1 Tax=Streptococcus himalayensis TaxID=1888195 RepID=A0A917EEW3_9STRE|nr:hypothetical protein [Streptococcus himalayensis]GGE33780.1 hypothetical protein GCM10011510_13950 [Streptococcus himalayensis]
MKKELRNPLEESIKNRLKEERYQISEKKKEKQRVSFVQLLLIVVMGIGLVASTVQLLIKLFS